MHAFEWILWAWMCAATLFTVVVLRMLFTHNNQQRSKGMKRVISSEEREQLDDLVRVYTDAQVNQSRAVEQMMSRFRCSPAEATDLLNRHSTGDRLIARQDIEVYDAEACRKPWPADRYKEFLWLLIFTGSMAVVVSAAW